MLSIIALVAGVVFVIVAGIASESDALGAHLKDAKNTIEGWLKDLGVDPSTAKNAKDSASSSSSQSVSTLLRGVAGGVKQLSSLVFFLALTALSLFFLLKDGPTIRAWGERHLGVPTTVAHTVTQRVLQSLRGYFFGVTIVAAFNAVVVGGGALALGIPLAGTIAAITFFGAYVPYLGAWAAGAFAVLIALGGAGTDAAVAHDRDPAAGQRVAATAGSARRLWRGARHSSARRVGGNHRRRMPVRGRGFDPRCPVDLGRNADLGGPGALARGSSGGGSAGLKRPLLEAAVGHYQRA